MWLLNLLWLRLFFLRATPEQLPYSRALLYALATLVFVSKNIVNLWFIDIIKVYDKKHIIDLSLGSSAIIVAVYLLILVALVRTILAHHNLLQRCVQVITAFLAVDLLLTMVFLLWMVGLANVTLPLQTGSMAGMLLLLFFVLILYWQFMVYIHIIYTSMGVTILRAGVYALVYMLIQHNIAEILMNSLLVGERT